jgi:hypothetical protein
MPISLSLDDFKLFRAVCELRYENAYLLFDRTGKIYHDLRNSFTNLQVQNANPSQSIFHSEEGIFVSELTACRFTSSKIDNKLEAFSAQCKTFFGTVSECLELNIYTRIGLRVFFRRELESFQQSKATLASLKMTNVEPSAHFGTELSPREVTLRWEGDQIGTLLRQTRGQASS